MNTKTYTPLPESITSLSAEETQRRIVEAKRNDRPVVTAFGAHVIKVGCGAVVIDLIRRGIVNAAFCAGLPQAGEEREHRIGRKTDIALAERPCFINAISVKENAVSLVHLADGNIRLSQNLVGKLLAALVIDPPYRGKE